MPTPEYLENSTKVITEHAAQIGELMTADMVRRLVEVEELNELAIQEESQLLQEDILKHTDKARNITRKKILEAVMAAGVVAFTEDTARAVKAGKKKLKLTKPMKRTLQKTSDIAFQEIDNLTGTTVVSSQVWFIETANEAYRKAMSGEVSYTQAIIDAIMKIADRGPVVYYPSGHTDKLDVAMRRSVLSAVNGSSGALTLQSAELYGTDYVEVTAHAGARPSHAAWQGSVCCISGKDKRYPEFRSYTGYGTGAGLCGWNCKHSFHLFFPGISRRAYTDEMLEDYSVKKYEWKGKRLTEYECTQQQREYEREIRHRKRLLAGYDAGRGYATNKELVNALEGLFTKEAVKLKSVERELKEFCRKTNRYVESSRGGAIGYTRSTAQKVVWANKKYTKTFGFDIIKNNRYLKNYARLDVPDTIEKALAGTNPGYATGSIEYMLNCQRCVAAYDMRRRGLKVEAKPNISEYDALTDNYTLPWKGSIMVGCPSGSGLDKIKSEMKAYGDGARAVVRVEWADEKYGNAHVFIAEQIGGKTVFLDPQSGERDVSYYFNSVRSGTTTFIRIDNLDVTSYIKDCCKKVEKND